jgi:hypothetical protein
MVILTENYNTKIKAILSELVYRKLTVDPTNKVERKITSLIRMSGIPDDIKRKLILHAATPPRIYSLPEIHKETPLRPYLTA